MYCPSAFALELAFPEFFELPTTETGPVKPLTSSFVHTFLVFLASAAVAVAPWGSAGAVAEAGAGL
jgi:hypothetical protein